MQEKEYPRWLHHPTEESVLVVDAQEEADLGPGWYDSLADAKAAKDLVEPATTEGSRVAQIELAAKKRRQKKEPSNQGGA